MKLLIIRTYDHYAIVNDDADCIIGVVYPLKGRYGPYSVSASMGVSGRDDSDVGIITSLSDAIPTLMAYYKKYPLLWEKLENSFRRSTLHVTLKVEQDKHGGWQAYRDDYPLLCDGSHAHFATHTDAQRVADAHELDLFPSAEVIDDGFSWAVDPELDWRSVPHRVEGRAIWLRNGSLYLP